MFNFTFMLIVLLTTWSPSQWKSYMLRSQKRPCPMYFQDRGTISLASVHKLSSKTFSIFSNHVQSHISNDYDVLQMGWLTEYYILQSINSITISLHTSLLTTACHILQPSEAVWIIFRINILIQVLRVST